MSAAQILAQHRLAIVALMESVPGIGVVHPEEPYARTQSAFQAAYMADVDGSGAQQLRGWYVHRVTTRETSPSVGRWVNVHTWRLQGFMALATPGSGLEWDALVEAVREAFRQDLTLGGISQPLDRTQGVQVVANTPVMFAGVLCHSAQLQLQTTALF